MAFLSAPVLVVYFIDWWASILYKDTVIRKAADIALFIVL